MNSNLSLFTPPAASTPQTALQEKEGWRKGCWKGRILFSFGYLIVIFFAAAWVSTWNAYVGLAALVAMMFVFVNNSLKKISLEPRICNGIVTFWGNSTGKVLPPGLFFLPWPFGYVKVNAEEVADGLTVEAVTPDGAMVRVPVDFKIRFDQNNPVQYLESGKEEKITAWIKKKVAQAVRLWLNSRDFGPQTFREARGADFEALNTIVKAIAGDDAGRVPSKAPTLVLFKYYAEPRKSPSESETKTWGKNWEKLTVLLASEDEGAIKVALQKRQDLLDGIKQGKINLPLRSLGELLVEVTLGNIEVIGDVAAAEDEIVKAGLDRKANKISLGKKTDELNVIRTGIDSLKETGLNPEQCRRTVLVAQGKIKEEIKEAKHTWGLDGSLLEALKEIVGRFSNKPEPQGGSR